MSGFLVGRLLIEERQFQTNRQACHQRQDQRRADPADQAAPGGAPDSFMIFCDENWSAVLKALQAYHISQSFYQCRNGFFKLIQLNSFWPL
jgi:hypothetical protein